MKVISDVCLFSFTYTDFLFAGLQSLTKKLYTKSINTLDILYFCGFDYSLRQSFPFSWKCVYKLRYRFQMMTSIKFSHGINGFYLKLYYATDFMQGFNKAQKNQYVQRICILASQVIGAK